jgi:NADH dehydrogenase
MSDAFVLDNWMARFLTEHSSALSERRDNSAHPPAVGVDEPSSYQSGFNDGVPSGSNSDSQMETAGNSGVISTRVTTDQAMEFNDLSQLLDNQDMSGEAIVNSALNWLLDDDLRLEQLP